MSGRVFLTHTQLWTRDPAHFEEPSWKRFVSNVRGPAGEERLPAGLGRSL